MRQRQALNSDSAYFYFHSGCGPLFALCWSLYPSSAITPFLAASVPFLASIGFAVVGRELIPDVLGLIPGATRRGRAEELLRGPFIYGLVHAALAVGFWCRPGAIIAIATLCGGDGMAEVVGASVSSPPLPWNADKTVAGSFACFVGGTLFGTAMVGHFLTANAFILPPGITAAGLGTALVSKVAACALIGAIVESLPLSIEGGDNLTVPVAALIASRAILGT